MSEQIILPERFKRLSYLADTGLQWIDTEYIPTNNTGLWIDAQQNVHSNGLPMGSGVDTNSPADGFTAPRWLKSTGNTAGYAWGGWKSWGWISDGSRFVSSLNFNNDKKALLTTIGETSQSFTGDLTDLSFTPTKSIFLFTTNKNGNPHTYPWQGKIFEAKISEGTTVVRHFIPVYDTYTSRGCMYEVIEDKVYYNKGTSDFLYELDLEDTHLGILHKLPEGFTKVNYLIANGSQYIDTNYVPTNETGYYVEGQGYVSEATARYFFGSNETTDWNANQRIYFCATPNNVLGWMTTITVTNVAANLRQETNVALNFLNSRKCVTTINDADIINELSDLSFTPTQKIFLFSVNMGGVPTSNQGLKGRIDTFLISEGDQIVRQFVPCLDTDGIPCMYELYTGTVHYNQGTGQFSYPRVYVNDPINLPAGYKKCAYLQSNGTQWIDTGIIPNADTGLYLKAQHLSYGDYMSFGSYENESAKFYAPRFNTTNKCGTWSFGTNYQLSFYYDKGDDLIYTSTMNLYNDKTVNFWSDDTNWFGIISVNFTTTFTRSLWLFSYNMDGTTINATYAKWGGRIYRAKITQGDALIHDFVPCLDADNRPCMYDLVTQTPYYNQSGGEEFAYCVEQQLPSDFIKLKYLESNSNLQHIKTGYIPTNNTGMYVDAYNTVVEDRVVMGMQNTTGNDRMWIGGVMKATYGARYGWGTMTTPGGTGDVRFEASLNWLNDKKSIITCPAFAQRVNTLSDLTFTPNQDIYIFGWNRQGSLLHWKGRIYRAKISEGSEIVRDWFPAYDLRISRPCMFDLINSKAYYNDGEGEFLHNNDYEGTYTGFSGLGGIGNRLGMQNDPNWERLPAEYTRLSFLESKTNEPVCIPTEVNCIGLDSTVVYRATDALGGAGTVMFGRGDYYAHFAQYNNIGHGAGCRLKASSSASTVGDYLTDNPFGTLITSEINLTNGYIKVYRYNKTMQKTIEFVSELSTANAYIFARSSDAGYYAKAKIYSVVGSYGNTPACNFVPCLDTNGVPCMYDTVSEKPHYNTTSYSPIAGFETITHALSLRLPETGGSIRISIPTSDNVEIYEERIRNNNPNWTFTFFYHD